LPVHTIWDLGFGDSTAIWFVQFHGPNVYLVDYYENSGEALPFYFGVLEKKGYRYGKHWAPHDIKVHDYSLGITRKKLAERLGFKFNVVPDVSKDDGIDAARAMFARCWFDAEKTELGLRYLRLHRRAWDSVNGTWKREEQKGPQVHAADGFRYTAVVYNKMTGQKIPERAKFSHEQTMDEMMRDHFRSERQSRQRGRYG